MATRATRSVLVLIADRDLAGRQGASTGDSSTPGVIALAGAVTELVAGSDLGIGGVRVMPVGGDPITISDSQRVDLAGREAWSLQLQIYAGYKTTATEARTR